MKVGSAVQHQSFGKKSCSSRILLLLYKILWLWVVDVSFNGLDIHLSFFEATTSTWICSADGCNILLSSKSQRFKVLVAIACSPLIICWMCGYIFSSNILLQIAVSQQDRLLSATRDPFSPRRYVAGLHQRPSSCLHLSPWWPYISGVPADLYQYPKNALPFAPTIAHNSFAIMISQREEFFVRNEYDCFYIRQYWGQP